MKTSRKQTMYCPHSTQHVKTDVVVNPCGCTYRMCFLCANNAIPMRVTHLTLSTDGTKATHTCGKSAPHTTWSLQRHPTL